MIDLTVAAICMAMMPVNQAEGTAVLEEVVIVVDMVAMLSMVTVLMDIAMGTMVGLATIVHLVVEHPIATAEAKMIGTTLVTNPPMVGLTGATTTTATAMARAIGIKKGSGSVILGHS